jgi:spore coat protein A, manganese oxidase
VLTRRELLKTGLMLGAATLIPSARSAALTSDVTLQPFVDPLPLPAVKAPRTGVVPGAHFYEIRMLEVKQKLHRDLPPTTVWGYDGQYPGPTIQALRNVPVVVRWVNELRDPSGALRTTHYLPIDTRLHGPDHFGMVPHTVVHLHGGKVPPGSDGHPNLTIPPGQRVNYLYPNAQRAATLWYHDHTWGITRLNVYIGLAGFYLIRDPAVEGPLNLPSGEFDVPLVIQDRAFNADGSLKYPALWAPSFLGDMVLVNGKVWPFMTVKRGKYRFRVLNGSNTRTYTLSLSPSSPATMTQIGTEGGLLAAPNPLTQITLAAAERAELVIDFAACAPGDQITLLNGYTADSPPTVSNVMRFVVDSATGHTAAIPPVLDQIETLLEADAVVHRDIKLTVDSGVPGTGIRFSINHLRWDDITDFPKLGTIEVWNIDNNIGSMHPIHLHLVHFQVLDRTPGANPNPNALAGLPPGHGNHLATPDGRGGFTHPFAGVTPRAFIPSGPPVPPDPSEAGWKDTVQAPDGFRTRIIARFDGYTGNYPYHCHILEHEDHEMMRQFQVIP